MRRTLSAATAAVLTFGLAGAAPSTAGPAQHRAATAVTVGQVLTPTGVCGSGETVVQTGVAGAPTYTTPFAGVITAVSYQAGDAGMIRVVFLVPSPTTPGSFDSIGYDQPRAVAGHTLNTIPTRIRVPAGVTLGLSPQSSGMACWGDSPPGADQIGLGTFDPVTGSTFTPSNSFVGRRVDLAVQLEPDADRDGYGDVTQDGCAQSDLTHDACPLPETTVDKAPAARGTHRKVKVRFSSSIPGSTFACSLDGKGFKPCASPYKKRLKLGKHVLRIVATSPTGATDATPAEVRFRIRAKKRA